MIENINKINIFYFKMGNWGFSDSTEKYDFELVIPQIIMTQKYLSIQNDELRKVFKKYK